MSKASQSKARRQDTSYSINAKKNRCDACIHVAESRLHLQAGRYDRHCVEHDCPVKTHGTCSDYLPGEDADLPRDEFPVAHNEIHFF